MKTQTVPLSMRQDIQCKIVELKSEVGEWGRERRFKYLLECCLEADIELDELQEKYQDNFKSDGDYAERAIYNWCIEKWKKKRERSLREMKILLGGNKSGMVTDDDILKAREYPIENLIELKKGKALCIFHDDKHPSMSVKNNRYRCWSCGARGDSINLVMELQKLNFIEAVKKLTGR